MTVQQSLSPLEALELFREQHPELNSIPKILALAEAQFVEQYAACFAGDPRKARAAYRAAQGVQEQTALLWANIKDAVASPYIQQTLFHNIPQTFINHQLATPGYAQLFEKLDFIECDHCRSIFGPAAYFVDLLRFIEKHIPQDQLLDGHRLEDRQPRLFRMALDCENTSNLIPYIDLVNEVLEDVVGAGHAGDPYSRLEAAMFPMTLPFHLPLEEIRLYLQQLKISLHEIYQLFGAAEPELARELLALSPREYGRLEQPIAKADLDALYGVDVARTGAGSLENVDVFTEQTGLSRGQLNELLFLDLSADEVNAGLSRLSFINNTGDGRGHLWIEEDHQNSPTSVPAPEQYDRLVGLSLPKLDRIYRFLKLARRLGWSLVELDAALCSLAGGYAAELALRFDGLNDYVYVPLPDAQGLQLDAFTLEAWVILDRVGTHPIVCKGDPAGPYTHYLFWITPEGKLALYSYPKDQVNPENITLEAGTRSGRLSEQDWQAIRVHYHVDPEGNRYPARDKQGQPIDTYGLNLASAGRVHTGVFTHVAVSVNEPATIAGKQYYQLKFYINGALDSIWSLESQVAVADRLPKPGAQPAINIGKNLNDELACGSIKEVRLWAAIRTPAEIKDNLLRRFGGREADLAAYWPLTDSPYQELRDMAVRYVRGERQPGYDGMLGGPSTSARPTWVRRDLVLDPLPTPISLYAYSFNGRDEYLAAQGARGLDLGSARAEGQSGSIFTLGAQVRIDRAGPHTLVCKGDAATGTVEYRLWIDERNRLALSVPALHIVATSGWSLDLDTLTHVAVVAGPAGVVFYHDGQPDAQAAAGPLGLFESQGTGLYVGGDFAGTYLAGALQELRIWNVARTQEQIALSRFYQLTGGEPELAGYWPLDEADPRADPTQPARDRSFNRNDLLPGGILWRYQPTRLAFAEVLLPDPVRDPADVLSFDARSYRLSLTNARNYGLGHYEQFSLQFWFKADEPAAGRRQLLFSQGDADTGLSIYLLAGAIYLYAWQAAIGGERLEQQVALNTDLHDTGWHQLTFTYDETASRDGVAYRAYLDSAAIGASDAGLRLSQTGAAALGGLADGTFTRFHDGVPPEGSYYFAGQLADLRIWRRALAADDISAPPDRAHPRHIPPQNQDDLLCYLPMTDSFGRSVSVHESPLYDPDPNLPIYDQTANAHHGQLYVGPDAADPKWQRAQLSIYPPRALQLAGDYYLPLPNAADLGISDHDFTIEAWVLVDTFSAPMPIVGCAALAISDAERQGHGLYLTLTAAGLVRAGFYGDEATSDAALAPGAWHHIAWRYRKDQQDQILFVDGQPQPNGARAGSAGLRGDAALYLGRWRDWRARDSSWANSYFQGQISELRVWNSARTDDEIAALRQQRLHGSEAGLQGYWVFDQDPRYHLTDRSAAARTAVIETAAGADINTRWVEASTSFRPQRFAIGLNDPPGPLPDFVDLPGYHITAAGTIELWAELARDRDQILFDAADPAGQKPFTLDVQGGQLRFRLADASGAEIGAQIDLTGLSPEFEQQRHHLVAAWQFDPAGAATDAVLYLDDYKAAAHGGSGAMPTLGALAIGLGSTFDSATARPFQGKLGQVRIWDHMRSRAELQKLRYADLSSAEAGLLSYLPIDEAAGLVLHDLASGKRAVIRRPAIPEPAPTWIVAHAALQLDGADDYIELPGYQFTDAATLELWAKFARGRNQVLFDASNNDPNANPDKKRKFFFLDVSDGVLRFMMEDSQDSDVDGARIDLKALPEQQRAGFDAAWHHIVATWRYDSAARTVAAEIYLDVQSYGTARKSRSGDRGGSRPVLAPLFLGKRQGDYKVPRSALPFQGQIRQVRIWDEVRSKERLQQWRDAELSGTEQHLLVYLPFDDAAGTTLRNATPNGKPAIFQIGAATDQAAKWVDIDRALRLDGADDLVELTDYHVAAAGTIELWSRFSRGRDQILFDASDEAGQGAFMLELAGGKLRYWLAGQAGAPAQLDLAALPADLDAAWHHLAATWQYDAAGKTAMSQLFLDGQPGTAVQQAWDGTMPGQRSLYVGMRRGEGEQPGNYRACACAISQFRVWDRALSAAELAAPRALTLQGNEAGLRVYLPIDEGAGNQLVDASHAPRAVLRRRTPAAPKWSLDSQIVFRADADYAVLPRAPQLGVIGSDFSCEAWVNLPSLAGVYPILGTRVPKDAALSEELVLSVDGGILAARMQGQSFKSSLQLAPDTWHHVAWAYSASARTLSMFVDGVPEQHIHQQVDSYAADRGLYAGLARRWDAAAGGWEQRQFQGMIEELRIWNTARSADQLMREKARRLSGDEAGLAACWTFTGEQRRAVRDRSGHGYHLELTPVALGQPAAGFVLAAPPLDEPDPRAALTLDGYNDYLDLEEAAVAAGGAWTVECWFSGAQAAGRQTLFSKQGHYKAALVDGSVQIEWHDRDQGWRVWERAVAVAPGQWSHLALVYDGSRLAVYINAERSAGPQALALVANGGARMRLGADAEDAPANFLSGRLAEVRLWDTARNGDEIRQYYQHRLTGREAHLLSYWPLDEGRGSGLRELTESLPGGTLVTGLENAVQKWLPAPPIPGATTALTLDGRDDHVLLPSAAELGLDRDFTVEAWVRVSDLVGAEPIAVLGSGAQQLEQRDNQSLCLGIKQGRAYFSFGSDTFQSSEVLDQHWHHLTWQYVAGSKTMRIIVDDAPAEEHAGQAPFAGRERAYLGRWDDWDPEHRATTSRYFQGQIGEVRIWSILRSYEDIRRLRLYRLNGDEPGLAAYWIFDDHNQSTIASRMWVDDNTYQLVLRSDRQLMQPRWVRSNDHPILQHPLDRLALSFDGVRQYLATDRVAFPSTFTVEAWVKPARAGSPIIWAGGYAGAVPETDFVLRVAESGAIEFACRKQGDTMLTTLASTATVPIDTFTHVAVAVVGGQNQTTITLFIDGAAQAPAIFDTAIHSGGAVLLVGRDDTGAAPAYFKGLIKELRIWNTSRSAGDLNATIYHPLATPAQETGLIGYWPLDSIVDELWALDLSAGRAHLRLGGLPASRKPISLHVTGQKEFFDPRRLALMITERMPGQLPIPVFNPTARQNRMQRTVEVWFVCQEPLLSERQIIYEEGDADRGLSISVQAGALYFTGRNTPAQESGWQTSIIRTERVEAGRWHHAAIVLDGRAGLRDEAFRAMLDGRLVDTRPGSQLWGAVAPTSVGGLRFTPRVGERVDRKSADQLAQWQLALVDVTSGEAYLRGQIKEVRIWEAARTVEQIQANMYGIATGDGLATLIFYWDTERLPDAATAALLLPTIVNGAASLSPAIPLVELASICDLQQAYKLSVDKLGALWSGLRHSGAGDGYTFYDQIFNPAGTPDDERWPYHSGQPRIWEVDSTAEPQRRTRGRLMSALRVSHDDLNRMVGELSGPQADAVILDGDYLSRLYRIKLLATMLKLPLDQLLRLVKRLKFETALGDQPLNDLARFGIRDVELLRERAEWMRATGISLAEYEYLAYDQLDPQVAPPPKDAAVVAMAGTLLSQAAEFLVTRTSLAELLDGDEAAARTIYAQLLSSGLTQELERGPQGRAVVRPEPAASAGMGAITPAVIARLATLRHGLSETIVNLLADLLDADTETLRAVMAAYTGGRVDAEDFLDRMEFVAGSGSLAVAEFLDELSAIVEQRQLAAGPAVASYLDRLRKTLFLLSQFDLSDTETATLLARPELFGLDHNSLLRPSQADLAGLYSFVQLKDNLGDTTGQLVQVLRGELALSDFSGWAPGAIQRLAQALGLQQSMSTLPALARLSRAFRLVETLGADAEYLAGLAGTGDLSFAFYRSHADALYSLLSARYGEEQWPQIAKPIHDLLAIQRRDGLIAVALEDLAPYLHSGKRADLLYEYLLIDVQTGSETDTSRIVQGVAALQMYVERCLMNLERDVDPAAIPQNEWQWMKNYRVWEANRKVFLYPENYIEPELRDTRTPLFQELADELQQNDVNKESVEVAFTRYLDKLAEVAKLTIVGSYVHVENPDLTQRSVPALIFSGAGHIEISSIDEVAQLLPRDFTVEMWVKLDNVYTMSGLIGAYNWDDADPSGEQKGWGVGVTAGRFDLFVSTKDVLSATDKPQPGTFTRIRSLRAYPADRWFHVAATYDGSRIALYVDGVEAVSTFDRSGDIYYPDDAGLRFTLGAWKDQDSNLRFRGSLRDVRIWDTARTQQQIYANMYNGITLDGEGKLPTSLIHYWKIDDGPGKAGDNQMIVDHTQAGTPNNLSFTSQQGISWGEAEDTTLLSAAESTIDWTLYLVGRNETTREIYHRELSSRTGWGPWAKIELAISADFVSPVFAFNRLYLFWAELQDHVEVQDRVWVNTDRKDTEAPVDQLGQAIKLKSVPAGVKYAVADEDGGTINPATNVVRDKFNVVEKVSLTTAYKVIVKYSYHNFSKAWVQPQVFLGPTTPGWDKKIDKWDRRTPKWQRVYVQRALHSFRDAPLQPVPETLTDVKVLKLAKDSYVERDLPAFVMDELTLTLLLQAQSKREPASEYYRSYDQPASDTFTLLTYNERSLQVMLTTQPREIASRRRAYEAVDRGLAALQQVGAALGSIQSRRSDPQGAGLLDPDVVTAAGNLASLAKDATTDPYAALAAQAATSAKQAAAAIKATPATLPATPPAAPLDRAQNAAALATAIAAAATAAAIAAAQAGAISGEAQSDALAADLLAKQAGTAAAEAIAAANDAATTANEPLDPDLTDEERLKQEQERQAKLEAYATAAESQLTPALTDASGALGAAVSAAQHAMDKQNDEVKWEAGDHLLKLRLVTQTSTGQTQTSDPTLAVTTFVEGSLAQLPNDQSFHHVAFTLKRADGVYRAQAYLEGIASGAQLSFATFELPPGKTMRIGRIDDDQQLLEAHASELCLWNAVRETSTIKADTRARKTGREVGLFHLPLDGTEVAETATWERSNLALTLTQPPIIPVTQQERIIMVYGDTVRTLRSNLEDKGVLLELKQPYPDILNYSISLMPAAGATYLRIDKAMGVAVDNYRAGVTHALDRFAPGDRAAIHPDSMGLPDLLKAAISGQGRSSMYPALLRDLTYTDCYIMDVDSQPGWYILDAGNEQFLVQIDVDDMRIKTAEERLRFQYGVPDPSQDTLPMGIFYERDRALEDHPQRAPRYRFERLNTFLIYELSERLFAEGIDGLLNLKSQQLTEPNFTSKIVDAGRVIGPNNGAANIGINFDGPYGLYYREIFFHIPFLIANQLNVNQKFAEAQRWYHYIFNPTPPADGANGGHPNDRYWRYLPFRNLPDTLEQLAALLSNPCTLARYRDDPFDPHAIAELRVNAYQKAVVMKYIDNLIDWGDFLFRQDTRESINEALPLYVLAATLLGPRPKAKKARKFERVGDYQALKAGYPGPDGVPDFVIARNGAAPAALPPAIPFSPHSTVTSTFGVIENEQFMGYWDRVEDRLYKIRHSLNIDGVFRSLALFQPPLNPALLVRAVAGGGVGALGDAIAMASLPVPHYRFSYVIARARELTGTAIGLGSALLIALEKKDAEALTLLQQSHEVSLLKMMTEVKKLQREVTERTILALEESHHSAQHRYQFYKELFDQNLLPLEIAALTVGSSAKVMKSVAAILHVTSGVAQALPTLESGGAGVFGSPVATVHIGGREIGIPIQKVGKALEIGSEIAESIAQLLEKGAYYELRRKEWGLQRDVAESDAKQIAFQLAGAELQKQIAEHELTIHQQTIAQREQVGAFFREKFSSQELYSWMSSRLSGLYFQAYKMAFDMAKQAERAYQFEFGTGESYIGFDAWDSRRKGLLAGESLMLDLARLDKAAMAQNSRYLEVEKTISLARLDPLALIQLKDAGRCQFSLDELLFDHDYPGHYFRIIKSVALSIPAVVGPYQTVKATLTQTGHKTLLEPDVDGAKYLIGANGDIPASIRADWRSNQQIAISRGIEDSGVFELRFSDERYLPFEGTGAVSTWLLEMPKATNPIDFDTITDVIIHLRYSAKTDSGRFRSDIMELEEWKSYRGTRVFNLANEFAPQWYAFKNDAAQTNGLDLPLPDRISPPNVEIDLDSISAQIYSLGADGSLKDATNQFNVAGPAADQRPLKLKLTPRSSFKKATSENLLLLLSYTGQLTTG